MIRSDLISDTELREKDAKYCSFADTAHYAAEPKVFRGCEGSFMFDSKDVPYLDLQMYFSAANFGYKNKRIIDAVIDQMNMLPQITPKYVHESKVLLSEKLCKACKDRFGEDGRVNFNVGGAQSVEDALKVVRKTTGRNGLFAFQGGYHGKTVATTAISSNFKYRENYGHYGDRAHFIPFPYCFRCPFDKKCDSCDFYCVKHFEKQFDSEYKGFIDPSTGETEYKAFIGEPVLGTGGYIEAPQGYFKELKKVLDKFGIMYVDDEIQMGFYRTGKLWAIENYGVTPDIIVFAKSLTNGMNPLSGFWAKEQYINPKAFPPGSAHSTFCSNPIGTRAGYEVMKLIEEEDFETMVAEKSKYFKEGLNRLKDKYKCIGDVGGLGLALRAELVKEDGISPNKELCAKMLEEGLKGDLEYKGKRCGIILHNGGFYKNIITFVPSLYISYAEIDMAIELLDILFTRCTKFDA